MRLNFTPSHRQSRTSIKDDSSFCFLDSDFYWLVFIHLFPIGIDDDICGFWAYIYRNHSFSIKNSSIRTADGKMHDIGSRFIEFIVYNWSLSDWFVSSIYISIIPKIISRWNCLIGRISRSSRIKSYGKRSWSRTRRKRC